MRKLIDGASVTELQNAITLTVKTKCPHKYLLIDLETNETYRGSNLDQPGAHWVKIRNDFLSKFPTYHSANFDTAAEIKEILDAVDALLKL